MSLVGLVMFRNLAIRNRQNAAANIMSTNEKSMNAIQNSSKIGFGSANAFDKNAAISNARNSIIYKASSLMQESAEKQLEKNIKNSFNTFA